VLKLMMTLWLICLGAVTAQKAPGISGTWAVTITTADGKMTGDAFLTQTGDKVSGRIGPPGDATIPIEGVLTGQRLKLTTHPQPGRTSAFETCELTVGDQKMAGSIQGGDLGKGTIEFVRVKT
jgi:hypothetical protein